MNQKWKRSARFASALLLSLALITAAIAYAAGSINDGAITSGAAVHGDLHHQHGGTAGHLPASSANVRLVGKMNINQDFEGRVADVGVFGNYAYLAAFAERDCQKGGVYVFDISNPAQPKQINFIRTNNNSFVGEGVQVIHVDTAYFNGDLLIHNNEICDVTQTGAIGGATLIDVTNPKVHKYLARGVGDFTPLLATGQSGEPIAHEIHSAFAWDAGDKAYAVLVDDQEAADVDILDITDPRNPVLIAEYDLAQRFPQILQAGLDEVFLHDMIVKKIGSRWMMLLSYWDAGYVILDVTDPLNPIYKADSDFTTPDPEVLAQRGEQVAPEGNGHQSEFSLNNDYIVAADEDFFPEGVNGTNTDDGTTFRTASGSDTPPLPAGVTSYQTVFVGRACPGDPAVPPATGPGQLAAVERGLCLFTEKLASVDAAGGYAAVLIFNREGNDPENAPCTASFAMTVAGNTPTVGVVPRDVGLAIFDLPYDDAACRDANLQQAPITIGTVGDTITLQPFFDGWGYVHLFKNGTGKLKELDTFAIPESMNPAFSVNFGDLSVHEVAMSEKRNDLAYLSYYAGGFRVLKIVGNGNNTRLEEVGHFIDQGGNNFWGVQVWQFGNSEYVLASDRDYGVYIFEYTGP